MRMRVCEIGRASRVLASAFGLVVGLLGLGGGSAGAELPADVRALWVVRTSLTDGDPARIPIEAARLGANTLFVQVSGRGDAYYRSEILPRAEDVPEGTDPFSQLLEAARPLGLSVHAWINVGLVWSAPDPPRDPDHVLHTHPEWMMQLPGGVSFADLPRDSLHAWWVEGVFAELSHEGYRAHVAAVAKEIVSRYAIDGVHLDYIRRPILDGGYDEQTLMRFARSLGRSPQSLMPGWAASVEPKLHRWPNYSDEVDNELHRAWNESRRGSVTAAVAAVREAIDGARAGTSGARPGAGGAMTPGYTPVLLSAAVIPDPVRARKRFAQDWPRWLREGHLDFVVPMCYARGRDAVAEQVSAVLGESRADQVVLGVGVWNQPLGEASRALRAALGMKPRGVCAFSFGALEEDGFAGASTLRRAWWPEWGRMTRAARTRRLATTDVRG